MEYISNIQDISYIENPKELEKVCNIFDFRVNAYYLSLIDWDNPNDPIRRIVIPNIEELAYKDVSLDISQEKTYTVAPGCEHKYRDTAILLVSNNCGCRCRFCFRKRIFMKDNKEVPKISLKEGISYIQEHEEISNVLLTGGDPLMLPPDNLIDIILELYEIDHVKIVRIGTKMLAFDPNKAIRFFDRIHIRNVLFQKNRKQLYLITHFNHPNEFINESLFAIEEAITLEFILLNQTPLIKGVNDNPKVLGELLNKLSYSGISPYYVFICRPVRGNETFLIPIEKAYSIFSEAQKTCSGIAKRARLIMSHTIGKIEIVGVFGSYIYFRVHRPQDINSKYSNIFRKRRNKNAYWYDDYLKG